jgi:mannose-6-phosphate isomerase
MWHVLRAEPGAKIAVGLNQPETPERVREAALTGEIVTMLRWIEVHAGDTYFIPAGTIHAIGGGLAICEIQQLSDVTYRLYDFGRGRELHLDQSLDVAHLTPYNAGVDLPFECPYFRTDTLAVSGAATLEPGPKSRICVVLEGDGTLADQTFQAGEAWEIAANEGPVKIESPGARLIISQT